MQNNLFPLDNYDLFKSEMPKEIIEYYILTKGNVDKGILDKIFNNKHSEYEKTLDSYYILSEQYHLMQKCFKIETPLYLEIEKCGYIYENFDNQKIVGNYYVPHFYIFNENTQINNSSGKKYHKEINSRNINVDKESKDIINLITQINAEPKDVHIAFIDNDGLSRKEVYNKFRNLKNVLDNRGYDTSGNFFYNKENEIADNDFDFGYFSWDDSIKKTITICIDLTCNRREARENITNYLTMMGGYNDFFIGGKLVYISYYFLEHSYNFENNEYLKKASNKWCEIEYPPYFIFPIWYYYPTTSKINVDDKDWEIRKTIWDFKNDPQKTTKEKHQVALEKVTQMVIQTIGCSFGFDLEKKVILFCIPSSTEESYKLRYEKFSESVCSRLNMINGFSEIKYLGNSSPKHLGGDGNPKYEINSEIIKDKSVIIFDDIYTSGKNMRQFSSRLERIGAKVIGGIVLGKTEKDKNEEYNLGSDFKGYYDFYMNNIWIYDFF